MNFQEHPQSILLTDSITSTLETLHPDGPQRAQDAIAEGLAHLQTCDPILAALIDRVGPYRLPEEPRTGDLLAVLAESILHQQLATKVAQIIHGRFVGLFPEGLSAEALEAIAEPDLRAIGISHQKISYLKSLAQHTIAGLPSLDDLDDLDDETIIKTLTPIRGIGRWTVQMLLMFRLQRRDVLPVDDLGIRTAMQRLYTLETLPKPKQMEAIATPWQPWRTMACWYLWQSLDQKKP